MQTTTVFTMTEEEKERVEKIYIPEWKKDQARVEWFLTKANNFFTWVESITGHVIPVDATGALILLVDEKPDVLDMMERLQPASMIQLVREAQGKGFGGLLGAGAETFLLHLGHADNVADLRKFRLYCSLFKQWRTMDYKAAQKK